MTGIARTTANQISAATRGHRLDIDGLRAIAVGAVVLFHAGFQSFGGGFAGVDIFFVISGYLITQVIVSDIRAEKFSILKFYERRVRRILPALFFVIFFCFVAASVILLPPDFKDFSKTTIAAIFSTSNIIFWKDSYHYFAAPSAFDPLLHTWSLSVEEQFYIFYPLALYFMTRHLRKMLPLALIALFLASLGISVWSAAHDPISGFYLPPSRAWELMLGGILALGILPAPASPEAREGLAALGLAAIVASVLLLSRATPFPGYAALLPCCGTAAIILANSPAQTRFCSILRARPVVFVGVISYSLYLWHWPIFVFARLTATHALTHWDFAALIALSVGLSIISWRYIEQPFRSSGRRALLPRRALFFTAGGTAFALGALSVAGYASGGWPDRYPPRIRQLADLSDYAKSTAWISGVRQGRCFLTESQNSGYDVDTCFKPVAGKHNVLVWGDSLAADYTPGLRQLLPHLNTNLLQATKGSCPPLIGLDHYDVQGCQQFNALVWSLIRSKDVDGVILSANWLGTVHMAAAARLQKLRQTIAALHALHIPVLVFGPSIEYDERFPLLEARYLMADRNPALDPSVFLRRDLFARDRMMRESLGHSWASYLSVAGVACPGHNCPQTVRGFPVIFDDHHLTRQGSEFIVARLAPYIANFVRELPPPSDSRQ